MEENFPQLNKKKIIDRIISRINTDSSEFQIKIKQRIKQRYKQAINEKNKGKNIPFSSSLNARRDKHNLFDPQQTKSEQKLNTFVPTFFIYNDKSKSKIIEKVAIKDSSEFLIIERASIHQKQQSQSIKSMSSRRESLKSLNETQRTSNTGFKQVKASKLSAFYLNHSQQLKNSAPRTQFAQDSYKQNIHRSNLVVKSELIFKENLAKYHEMLEKTCQNNSIEYKPIDKYENHRPVYKIEENNANIVEAALKKRWWWALFNASAHQKPIMLWTQLKDQQFHTYNSKIQYPGFVKVDYPKEQLPHEESCPRIQLHNHLKNNKYITNKIALFEISNKIKDENIKIPKKYYIHHKTSRFWTKFQSQNYKQYRKRCNNILLNYLHENNKLWIIKNAEHQNKSHFLRIFNAHNQIEEFLKNNLSVKQTFMIEEYIQNPFLYKNRKFNVKSFALITKLQKDVKLYWYNEGFIELSSQNYDQNSQDPYIHFASEAIQINHPKFGEFELQNKITFADFERYLHSINQNTHSIHRDAVPIMKKTARFIIQSAYNKLCQQSQSSFELIELSYVIDVAFVPWLISVHTNPCLEGTCPIIQKLLPRLVDDIFKLTLDAYYPPPKTWPKSKYYLLSKNICENGFQEIKLNLEGLQPIDRFEYEKNIDDQKRQYDNNAEQNDLELMHFFPEKMKSTSIKSINF